MTVPTPAERELYSDLTRLFMAMRHAPFADLEQKIEERFREFARLNPGQNTEYRTLPVEQPSAPRLAVAGGSAEIVAFPTGAPRPLTATECAGQVIAFPGG